MDEAWLTAQLAATRPEVPRSASVAQMWDLLNERALGFAASRPDVRSAAVTMPRRGLRHDESSSFLRAVSSGLAFVDSAGYVTLPTVRQKSPPGRYALFSRNGDGVSVNLEYVIQVGATAELILDHGWPPERIGFEQGEFDAIGYDGDDRIVLAMEAKARTRGPDSLEKLVRSWFRFAADSDADLRNNAGRKWRELSRLCHGGSLIVWLVADGARWTLRAEAGEAAPVLRPVCSPGQVTRAGPTAGEVSAVIARTTPQSMIREPGQVKAAVLGMVAPAIEPRSSRSKMRRVTAKAAANEPWTN